MKKLLILLLILSALWIVKISFDLYRLSAGQEALGQQQKALEQRNASLNDQLAALNRQLSSPAAPANAQDAPLAQPAGALQPAALIGQQLDLVEFALRQQQYCQCQCRAAEQAERSFKSAGSGHCPGNQSAVCAAGAAAGALILAALDSG